MRFVVLPLPENVKEYLLDDGTLVVSGREDPPSHAQEGSDDAEEIQWSDDENTTTLKAPEFPEFTAKVQEAIISLGGSVFPKLNWSAPRDAYWIAMNSSLKCKALSDIFLLFKSSDFITRDLTQPSGNAPVVILNYLKYRENFNHLVLRKWCELIPGAEFRCFVKENKLLDETGFAHFAFLMPTYSQAPSSISASGISQRDYTQYYDHISKQHEEICRAIQEFFKKHIQYKFLDEDFVFDVYRDSRGKIWLIDFNPFGEVTDSLLFTWEELTSGKNLKGDQSEGEATEQDYPVFRCTNSKVTVQPSPYLSYRLPKDFVDLSTGEDVHKLIDFLKLIDATELRLRTPQCKYGNTNHLIGITELQKDPVGLVTDSDRLETGSSLSSHSKGKKAHLVSFVLAYTWERDSRSFEKEMQNGIMHTIVFSDV
ncbi:hypothetical protein IHE44_0012631 [Lamprotornis superbus]|uniref:Translation initiation factor eIF2 assembly protein n=1 Tax=Lamprotornis superbus TaxID=245042 RepID=A0A835NTR4_9PASS|nr:hypothetical protein IHE44_0012631 [Lamprotornis superbus]